MTTGALEQLKDDVGPLTQYATTTAISLTVDPHAPFEGWAGLMGVLGELGRGVLWWSGDALHQGEELYGEKYAQAMESLHVDYQTLANRVWVSKKIPPESRRVELSWTHHQVVAGLPTLRQMEHWLDRAVTEKWDSKTLAKEIRKAGRAGSDTDGDAHTKEKAPNVGPVVEAAVRNVLRQRLAAIKKPAEWAAKVFGKKATRDKEIQAWAKLIRAHVEHALDK